jgi:ABC-type uncharacterized transport system permease subunit
MPFSSLLFFPLSVFLERVPPARLAGGILTQIFWVVFFGFLTRFVWMKGLKNYGAEGG